MKKLIKVFIATLFMSFCSLMYAKDNDVFVLGLTQTEDPYVQFNSKLDHVTSKSRFAGMVFNQVIIGPVKEGSVFATVKFPKKGLKDFELKAVVLDGYYNELQGDKYRLKVKPNERGICLFYSNVDFYSMEESEFNKIKNSGMFRNALQKLIKKAIEQYAGTEWEEPLKAELEEWK